MDSSHGSPLTGGELTPAAAQHGRQISLKLQSCQFDALLGDFLLGESVWLIVRGSGLYQVGCEVPS